MTAKVTCVFGPAASGKSTLLARVHIAVSLGVIPKTGVLDLETFWTTKPRDMRRRADSVLRAATGNLVVGGAAVDPAFVRKALPTADVQCVFLDPCAFDYAEQWKLKKAGRGVGDSRSVSHQLDGAMRVALLMSKWDFQFRGSPESVYWYVINRHRQIR